MIALFTYLSYSYKKLYVGMYRIIITILLFIGINPVNGNSQNNDIDEVFVMLNVERVGSIEIPVVMYKEEAYLPVKEIFDFLKIQTLPSGGTDSITGYFINAKAPFIIDKHHILYKTKKTDLSQNDVFITGTNLYLKQSFFSKVFGLECSFDFTSLSLNLTTQIELPVIREMQQELMRKNISNLKGQTKADSTIARNKKTTGFGIADWSIMSTQKTRQKIENRMDLALGGMIAGGEARVLLNVNNFQPFSEKQQFYNWRYVNNSSTIAKQIVAGKMFTQATSTLRAPVVGLQFTNAPTTFRKSYGTYRLNSKTEPEWLVELYVNNILVNYTRADVTGIFSFDVPLVYGTMIVKLKFYGPWGEEQVREENISIPYNFLPKNQYEYTHASGFVEGGEKSIFSRTAINYGLNNHVTIGGGVEYLSSLAFGKTMPFINGSFRIASNIMVTGNYIYGVKAGGMASYRLKSNVQFDMEYTKYDPQQQAILASSHMERRVSVSMPVRGKNYAAYTKLTLNQVKYFKGYNTNGEFLVSGSMARVSANITTVASMQQKTLGYAYSNFSIGYRLPAGIRLQPQVRFEYNQNKISIVRLDVEKNFFNRGYVNFFYENDLLTKSASLNFGFRYDLSFVQTQFAIQKTRQGTMSTQTARGSLWINKGIGFSNRSHVGKGGVLVVPFLDVNGNNKYDKGEQKVDGLQLRTNGGNTVKNADTTIRITDLEAYTKFRLEFDKSSFDNIAWQLTNYAIDVEIQPNYITVVRVPVKIAGEVAGTVYVHKNFIKNGQGRIMVIIRDTNAVEVTRLLTEPDGYFSFLGLKPGSYTASIDADQLQKLKMKTSVSSISFNIKRNIEGDVSDGLEFLLYSLVDTLQQPLHSITKQQTIMKNYEDSAKHEKRTLIAVKPNIIRTTPLTNQKPKTEQKQTADVQKNIVADIKQKHTSSVQKSTTYIPQKKVEKKILKVTKQVQLNPNKIRENQKYSYPNKTIPAEKIKLQRDEFQNKLIQQKAALTKKGKILVLAPTLDAGSGLIISMPGKDLISTKKNIPQGLTITKKYKSPGVNNPQSLNKELEQLIIKLEKAIQNLIEDIQKFIDETLN